MENYLDIEKQNNMIINNKKVVIFDVITVPNKLLRKKSKKVNINLIKKEEFLDFILSLIKTMDYYDGVGLSAIQVGFDMRLFIIRKDLDSREEIQKERKEINSIDDIEIFINPEIMEYSKEVNEDWEGCLSVPNVSALIKRSNSIKVKFIDLNGNEVLNSYQGFKARVIQHEYDHLNGVLILDKAIKIEKE
ncbi:MAG: peptide deformylase [bacterium]|nr:peptide deformylase [bacterium]